MTRFTLPVVAALLVVPLLTAPPALHAQSDDTGSTTTNPADPFGTNPTFSSDPADAFPADSGDAFPSDMTFDPDSNEDFTFDQEAFDQQFNQDFNNDPFNNDPFNANQPPEELIWGIIAAYSVFGAIGCLFGLALTCLVCWLVSTPLKALPEEYQQMPPGQVWLLLIPCFPIVWNFFVYQRIAKSFQNYFAATGNSRNGDCGEQLGLVYAICVVCTVVPYLGCLALLAALVLLIVLIVKFWGMKAEVERDMAGDNMMGSTLDV